MAELQDAVVTGGGAGGFAAAIRAAQLGGKVTIIEKTELGGNCLNRACIPTKTLLASARLLRQARHAVELGITVEGTSFDLQKIHERKDTLIEELRLGTEALLKDNEVRIVQGMGRLAAADTVEVGDERIQGRNLIIATGSAPAQLPIEGADLPGVMGTEEAIELREVPVRFIVIGSGPWELELATFYAVLGSHVTVVERGRQLLPGEDHEIGQRMGQALREQGVELKMSCEVEAIRQRDDGSLLVVLTEGKGEIEADKVLATRRFPNSTGLGLREVGLKLKEGAIVVDERMETSVPHIYAIGDVTGGPMWSHRASAEGLVAAENAMGKPARINHSAIPRCLYTWPQVGAVGLTEAQAEEQGLEFKVGKAPFGINPYAMILGEPMGSVKIISGKYGKILGVHIIGPGAVDLISQAALAIQVEATVEDLGWAVPMHPSSGEAQVDAAQDVEGMALHLPKW